MTTNFETWMEQARLHARSIAGVELDDMPDQLYYDMYSDGLTPADAARVVLEDEGIEIMDDETASQYTQEFDDFTDADPGL